MSIGMTGLSGKCRHQLIYGSSIKAHRILAKAINSQNRNTNGIHKIFYFYSMIEQGRI